MLESALASGLAAGGGDVLTRRGPADPRAARSSSAEHGFDLGAVVSTSHNP